ncbi:hypothetical protein C4E44_27510 [Pseudomonas sp. MWU12-2312b]|nr:hypothetical protein C4E44_27510 [Pseudomonas sp. MWU12-2312b]
MKIRRCFSRYPKIWGGDIPVGLLSDLLQRRPEVQDAEHHLLAAHANIRAACRASSNGRIANWRYL